MSSRRMVRERVMQALYAFELSSGEAEAADEVRHAVDTLLRPHLEENAGDFAFAERLLLRTIDHTAEADEIIQAHAQNWDLARIALVDRILLRMAICELLTFEDIPPKVSINEAIEIAKKYSTPRSGQFINGILDAVLLDLQQQGRLVKSGRGLVGMASLRERTTS